MKTLFLLACMGIAVGVIAQTSPDRPEKYSRIVIPDPDPHTISQLQSAGIDLHCGSHVTITNGTRTMELECSAEELSHLKQNNISHTVVIDDVTHYYAQRCINHLAQARAELAQKKEMITPVNRSTQLLELSHNIPARFILGDMGGFLYYDQILSTLDTMAQLYPHLITARATLSETLLTRQGREIYWVKISDQPGVDEEEPEVLYTALTHAREPASAMSMLYYMWYLLENYEIDPDVKRIVDHSELYFVPVLNPDGYIYNESIAPQGGGMWRKNMHDNDQNEIINAQDGVDLNRNFGYLWGIDNLGSSPDPTKSTYRGAGPFSEPETAMLRDFVRQRHFITAMHDHTYGTDLYYPWEHGPEVLPDAEAFYRLSDLMAWENRYLFGECYNTYWLGEINGGVNDWFYGEQVEKPKIYSWLAEIGPQFWPDPLDIVRICQEQLKPHMMVAKAAGQQAMIHDHNTSALKHGSNTLAFRVENLGFGNGNFNISCIPMSGSVTNIDIRDQSTITFDQLAQIREITVDIVIDSRAQDGSEVSFDLVLEGEQYLVDRVTYTGRIDPVIAFQEEVPQMEIQHWESESWGSIHDTDDPSVHWITDSPEGNQFNAFNMITLKDTIDLSDVTWAEACFKARWSVETANDFVQLQARSGDGEWIPLESRYTKAGALGSEMEIPSAYAGQLPGQPLYDGRQITEIAERVDLNALAGLPDVQFRFVAWSGGYLSPLEEDGFYFRDFTVITSRKVHCSDNQQNEDETGVDCGGMDCATCATCSDGLLNGTETSVDCGGSDCSPCPSCTDGLQNNDEEGIDCGGAQCIPCADCNDGLQNGDEAGVDCGGDHCIPCPACNDGLQNGNETGIDCGGDCNGCAPTCEDGIHNGDEEDVDCGGSCPDVCKMVCCEKENKIRYEEDLNSFRLSPNPVERLLKLEVLSEEMQKKLPLVLQVEIFNTTGVCLHQAQTDVMPEMIIDVSALPAGLYILRLLQQEGTAAVYRFVRQQ